MVAPTASVNTCIQAANRQFVLTQQSLFVRLCHAKREMTHPTMQDSTTNHVSHMRSVLRI